MKTQKILFLSLITALFLTACSNASPECSDEETVSLVKKIAGTEMTKQKGKTYSDNFYYILSAIRTTEFNETTGARACAAQLEIHKYLKGTETPKEPARLPITYTVEIADNGKEIFVNVFGL